MLECESSSPLVNSFTSLVKRWIGVAYTGLHRPSDSYNLLIRVAENVMRNYVDIDTVSAKSLMVTELKELILELFMAKHYSV